MAWWYIVYKKVFNMLKGALGLIFLIRIAKGGIHLDPLGTAATNRPIVPTPGDYDDGEIGGMMTGRVNQSTPRKSATVPLCPSQTPHALPGRKPGLGQ
jgi:hypothetical protein